MLIEEEAYEKNKPKLDSALMNPALIATLKVMQENDQRYRKRLADARVTIAESERTKLWELQKSLDSLNLIKADSILLHHGYPDVQEVGADLENTIWFVLQHQEDIEVREKYRKLLESHLSEGQMEVYNRRTQHLKDNSN